MARNDELCLMSAARKVFDRAIAGSTKAIPTAPNASWLLSLIRH